MSTGKMQRIYLARKMSDGRFKILGGLGENSIKVDEVSIKDWCKRIAKWREEKGFKTHWVNVPEKLMLIVTELSEAMEAYRHMTFAIRPQHDKVYDNFSEELADTVIRLFDLCGSLEIDLEHEIIKKMKVNLKRPYRHGKGC